MSTALNPEISHLTEEQTENHYDQAGAEQQRDRAGIRTRLCWSKWRAFGSFYFYGHLHFQKAGMPELLSESDLQTLEIGSFRPSPSPLVALPTAELCWQHRQHSGSKNQEDWKLSGWGESGKNSNGKCHHSHRRHCLSGTVQVTSRTPHQLFEVDTSVFHFINEKKNDGGSENLRNLLESIQLSDDKAENSSQNLWVFPSVFHGLRTHLIQVNGKTIPSDGRGTHDLAVPQQVTFKTLEIVVLIQQWRGLTKLSHTFLHGNPPTKANAHLLLSPFNGHGL